MKFREGYGFKFATLTKKNGVVTLTGFVEKPNNKNFFYLSEFGELCDVNENGNPYMYNGEPIDYRDIEKMSNEDLINLYDYLEKERKSIVKNFGIFNSEVNWSIKKILFKGVVVESLLYDENGVLIYKCDTNLYEPYGGCNNKVLLRLICGDSYLFVNTTNKKMYKVETQFTYYSESAILQGDMLILEQQGGEYVIVDSNNILRKFDTLFELLLSIDSLDFKKTVNGLTVLSLNVLYAHNINIPNIDMRDVQHLLLSNNFILINIKYSDEYYVYNHNFELIDDFHLPHIKIKLNKILVSDCHINKDYLNGRDKVKMIDDLKKIKSYGFEFLISTNYGEYFKQLKYESKSIDRNEFNYIYLWYQLGHETLIDETFIPFMSNVTSAIHKQIMNSEYFTLLVEGDMVIIQIADKKYTFMSNFDVKITNEIVI